MIAAETAWTTAALRDLTLAPASAGAWDALGMALAAAGRSGEAYVAFAEAWRLAPADFARALRCADAAASAGKAAIELARRTGDGAATLLCRAHLLFRLGRGVAALEAADRASVVAPGAAEPAAERARIAFALRHGSAEAALRLALDRVPADIELRHKLGALLVRLRRPIAAEAQLALAQQQAPGDPRVAADRATAQVLMGHQQEARATIEKAIARTPNDPLLHRALCSVLAYADGVSGEELSAALRRCGALWPRASGTPFDLVPDPMRPLRVGLLPAAVSQHPVMWLTLAGFEALDPAAFELHCFAPAGAEDGFTARLRRIVRGWHPAGRLDDEALAALIRARRIDILIDLGGYLDRGRLAVLARRPAPVQVKWVGAQFHTTGLAEVDWIVTDRFETPPNLAGLYDEKLLTMPASYVCYDPPADAPEVGKLPARTARRVTFGSFNSFAKITPQVLAAWAAVLARVPRARLMIAAVELGEPAMAARVRQAFATLGIAPRRIEVVGGLDHRALLARYNSVDLALQPFPYCGGVTLLEGLWMGVPSIALAGESFAARHGASHLSQVGLADFIATSPEDYVTRAVALAADRRRLAQLRGSLRARVRESPLCDRVGFAGALGGALRRAWAAWCDTAMP